MDHQPGVKRNRSTIAAAAAILAGVGSLATAQPTVYEGFNIGFDVPVGPPVDLGDGNGIQPGSSGFGWSGPWSATLGTGATDQHKALGPIGSWGPDQDGTAPDNLDFGGYTASGETVGFSIRRATGTGVSTLTRVFNPSSLAEGLVNDGEIWLSCLVQAPSFPAQHGVGLGNTSLDADRLAPLATVGSDRLHGFHVQVDNGELILTSRSWWGDPGSANGYLTAGTPSIPVDFDEEMLVIVRYQFVAGIEDITTVYKVSETDAGRSLSEIPSSSHTTFFDPGIFNQLSMFDQGNYRLDEYRVAALAPGGDAQACLDAVAPGMNLSIPAEEGIYEPFALPFNTTIGPGGSSGSGWSDDWTVTRSSAAASANNNLVSRFIADSFGPDQDGVGEDNIPFDGYTDGGFTEGFSVRRLPTAAGQSAASRPFAAASMQNGLQEGGEVWSSVLIQNTQGFNSNFYFGLAAQPFDPETQLPVVTVAEDTTWGFRIQAGNGRMDLKAQGWRGNNGSGSAGFTNAGPDIPVGRGERMLIITRYQFFDGSNDIVTVYRINDSDSGKFLTEVSSSQVSGAFIDPTTFQLVSMVESGNAHWDEVRFVPVAPGGDPEAALDAVAPGMDLDIEPLPELAYNEDSADLYEPFDMAPGTSINNQGSGKGWGEAAPGDPSGANRWMLNSTGAGSHRVLDPASSFGSVDLFGTPELVFNGNTAQRDSQNGSSSITRMISPALAKQLFQEGGETWVSIAFDLNERAGFTNPVAGNNTQIVFANAPYGPEGFGNLDVGNPDVDGEFTGFGLSFTGSVEGVDTILRTSAYYDGWNESSDTFFPPMDITSTDWFSGDKIFVVLRVQWIRSTDGLPVDTDGDNIPDDGTTDIMTLWRLVPEFGIGDSSTDLDVFPSQELQQGNRYFDEQTLNGLDPADFEFPFGQVAVRNDQINMVSIAQSLNQAVDELRVSYVRPGEQSQDALNRVAPGLSLSVSNTADVTEPPCNAADLGEPFGILDLNDITTFVDAFLSNSPVADLAPDFGVLDLSDINAFVQAFGSGCP